MTNERILRRVERLLDRIDDAEQAGNWPEVERLAQDVLLINPASVEASAYLRSAERELGESSGIAPSNMDRGVPHMSWEASGKIHGIKLRNSRDLFRRFIKNRAIGRHSDTLVRDSESSFGTKQKIVTGMVVGVLALLAVVASLMHEDFKCLSIDPQWGQFEGLRERTIEQIAAVNIAGDVTTVVDYDGTTRIRKQNHIFKYIVGVKLHGTSEVAFWLTGAIDHGAWGLTAPGNETARSVSDRGNGWYRSGLGVTSNNNKAVLDCLDSSLSASTGVGTDG